MPPSCRALNSVLVLSRGNPFPPDPPHLRPSVGASHVTASHDVAMMLRGTIALDLIHGLPISSNH